MLSTALLCICAVACSQVVGAAARSDTANFLDDKWLTGRWDKFRDEPGTWNPGKPFDQASTILWSDVHILSHQALDPTRDPCLKVKCSRHKVCVAQDYQTANCVSQRRMTHSMKEGVLTQKPGSSKCKQCSFVHPSPVCGTDGHTYSTKCKLEYQACISGKQISMKCPGYCPCLSNKSKNKVEKKTCSDMELREVVSRLRDWFKVLHENGSQNKKVKIQRPERSRFDTSILPICKDSLGWMFNRLDTNFDLLLDQSELASLYLDKNEHCTKSFFNSCDTYRDGLISNNEWCSCFQRQQDPPCQTELSSIQRQQAGKKFLGLYIPSCDEDGYYTSTQCHGSIGQCWCVDRYGNEIVGSRTHGPLDCGVDVDASGDFGSGHFHELSDDEDGEVDILNDEDEIVDDDEDEGDDEDDEEGYIS
ncbi:testican-3 isoform X1 [Lepisosteus oculatus]|uniref:Testican-3 n=1 Tax=Lepisosteus oculatus TaxID=7918 RepID=W5M6Y0_LEPOC|nr:PREDICTED: testican-3 isoform X2 [Lepisosteus oculatus]